MKKPVKLQKRLFTLNASNFIYVNGMKLEFTRTKQF